MTSSLSRGLATAALVAAACASYAAAAPTGANAGTAGTAARADTSPPFSRTDPRGDVEVRRLDGSGVTRPEARSVDITRIDFDSVSRRGQRTVKVSTTIRRVLPESNRYRQVVQSSIDEEFVMRTYLPSGVTLYRQTAGGPANLKAGCNRLEGTVKGRVVTQYIPRRCLPSPTQSVVPTMEIRSLATNRLVGTDALRTDLYQESIPW